MQMLQCHQPATILYFQCWEFVLLLSASFPIFRSVQGGHVFITEFHVDGLFQAIFAAGFVWMGQTH